MIWNFSVKEKRNEKNVGLKRGMRVGWKKDRVDEFGIRSVRYSRSMGTRHTRSTTSIAELSGDGGWKQAGAMYAAAHEQIVRKRDGMTNGAGSGSTSETERTLRKGVIGVATSSGAPPRLVSRFWKNAGLGTQPGDEERLKEDK